MVKDFEDYLALGENTWQILLLFGKYCTKPKYLGIGIELLINYCKGPKYYFIKY